MLMLLGGADRILCVDRVEFSLMMRDSLSVHWNLYHEDRGDGQGLCSGICMPSFLIEGS